MHGIRADVGGPPGGPLLIPPELVGLEVSLGTVSIEELESTALRLSRASLQEFFDTLTDTREMVLLRTCHRVELYLWTEHPEAAIAQSQRLLPSGVSWTLHRSEDAIRHVFRVSGGLESMAVGEGEVREQVRAAASRVLSLAPRPVLRPLLLAAASAADRAAPEVPTSRSVAALAAGRLLEESPTPFPRVLVVGSGHVGRQIAELLAPSCRVTILFRSHPPDARFLRAAGARASPWDSLRDEIAVSDVVVTAAKSGERIIDRSLVDGRTSPLLLVDLGVPRNVDPAVVNSPRVRLIDLEGLRPREQVEATPGFEEEMDRSAEDAADSIRAAGLEIWVDFYRRQVETVRRELLEEARGRLGPLSLAQDDALNRLTRRLVAQLLHGSTQGVRAIPSGPEGDSMRRWVQRWLIPRSTLQ